MEQSAVNAPVFLSSLAVRKFSFWNRHLNESPMGNGHESIGFLLKGRVEITSRRAHFFADAGDLIYIPRTEVYTSCWTGSPEVEFLAVHFTFSPPRAHRGAAEGAVRYKLQALHQPDGELRRELEALYEGYCRGASAVYDTIGMFYRLYGRLTALLERDSLPAASPVAAAVAFMEADPAADCGVPRLARLCGMSQSRFYDTFKRSTGYTPVEYRNLVRVQLAAELLHDGGSTVEWVSDYLNFSSPAYFRRVFKKYCGHTPGYYRDHIRSL